MAGGPGLAPQGMPPAGLAAAAAQGMNGTGSDLDLFQRVAKMATDNPMWVLLFAGMGLREALEKSGKYESKPHRSNEQLAQTGYSGQQQGQSSGQGLLASPGGMAQQLPPGRPGLPGMGQ